MSARRSQLIDYKLRLEKPESPQTPDVAPVAFSRQMAQWRSRSREDDAAGCDSDGVVACITALTVQREEESTNGESLITPVS